ncbi:MAG TPA: serine hydrolase domain-containing protein [Steroidobacteraceae bacterium]|nr:serine hydrolase domain-containing protein [Steroidobacteraceae bacterium]
MSAARTLGIAVVALGIGACSAQPSGTGATQTQASLERSIDAAFDDVYARYRLPGLALGVVRDGKIVYTRTSGETVAGSGQRIDSSTLFKIASNSKAMTTGVLARLVDAGKLRWDDPVTRYLPQFRMHDPWVTREMQVRDLLLHNSGLREGAGDLMFWPEPNLFTRADVIAGLAHLKPATSFRASYDYDNLMYVVAGEVAAAAAGVPYEDLVRRELFTPLQMTRCQAGAFQRDAVGNVAQPHMRQGDGNVVIRQDPESIPVSTSAAAGGIRCSLDDMLKWMSMWLDPDSRWLTPAQREAVWTPHMPMPLSARQRRWDGSRFNAYGYGWRLSDVDGVLRVAHTGTLAGMYSAVTLLPEKRSGFVLMINGEGSEARTVLNEVLVKLFTAPGERRRVADYAAELAKERQQAPQESKPPALARAPAPAGALARELGIYRDPWFGEVAVCERDGGVDFSAAKSPLLSGDVMQAGIRLLVDWRDASVDAEAWLDFSAPAPGAPVTLRLSKVDPEADFSYDYQDLQFTRVGDCAMKPEVDALMRNYTGDVPGAAVLVLRDGQPLVRAGYGLADLETHAPVTAQTNFRLASVTKQFTAASILLLAEDGRVKLDDRVRKWLPSLPRAAEAVTIRHLLTHTSGLIDYEDVIPQNFTAQLHDADVLKLLQTQDRWYFRPGTGYRYSNSGYALLALIVERASGKTFATFLRERIFQPVGMTDTVAHQDGISTVADRAFGYTQESGRWSRTDQSQTSAVLGDGGIYSSIDDLAKWDAALYDGRLLQPSSLQAAFASATRTDDPEIQYGFGWRITGETLWHSGETVGFRNVIVRYPKRHMTVVVLTNRNEPEPYRLALQIAQRVIASRSP